MTTGPMLKLLRPPARWRGRRTSLQQISQPLPPPMDTYESAFSLGPSCLTFTPELMRIGPGQVALSLSRAKMDQTVLVDGAHNAQALKALVRGYRVIKRTQNKVQAILYSCVDTRTPDELLGFLKPLGCPIYLCPSSVDRSLQLEELRQTSEKFEVFNSVHEGLKLLSTRVTIDGIIVVTGSLFAVADAKLASRTSKETRRSWVNSPRSPQEFMNVC